MASSLRTAATRLLRPAGEGLRRLVRTLQHSGSTRAFEERYPLSQIQQKKEELYDLIADAYAKSVSNQRDRYVLKILSTQIMPRPYDPQWNDIITIKKMTEWTVAAFILVSSVTTLGGVAQVARKKLELEMPNPVEPRRIKRELQKQVE